METLTKGDIVLFPFPYTNLTNRKLRPCLVLSEEMNDDILLCQITSQNARTDPYVVPLRKNETIKGTLHIASYIRTNMLFTADKRQIRRRICSLKKEKYDEITQKILHIIT